MLWNLWFGIGFEILVFKKVFLVFVGVRSNSLEVLEDYGVGVRKGCICSFFDCFK